MEKHCYLSNKICSCLGNEEKFDIPQGHRTSHCQPFIPPTESVFGKPACVPNEQLQNKASFLRKHGLLYPQFKRNEEFQFGWGDLQEVFTCSTTQDRYHRLYNPNGYVTSTSAIEEKKRKLCSATDGTASSCTCQMDNVIELHHIRNKRFLHDNVKERKQRPQKSYENHLRVNKYQSISTKTSPDLKRRRRKPQKPRNKPNQCLHLWEFLRDALKNPAIAPRFITWTDQNEGEFRIVKTSAMAALWGQSKNRNRMTYEKMARAMRYYYKLKILERVPSKRLHFRFSKQILYKIKHFH